MVFRVSIEETICVQNVSKLKYQTEKNETELNC